MNLHSADVDVLPGFALDSIFPEGIAGAADLYNHANFTLGETAPTLASGINSAVTSFAVASGTGANLPLDNFVVTIDSEIMFVLYRTGDTLNSVVRAVEGTSAASHLAGASVSAFITAKAHNQLAAEINAIEENLGIGLSNVIVRSPLNTQQISLIGSPSITGLQILGDPDQTSPVFDVDGGGSTLTPTASVSFRGQGLSPWWDGGNQGETDYGAALVEINVETTSSNPGTFGGVNLLLSNQTAGPATETSTAIFHDDNGALQIQNTGADGNGGSIALAAGTFQFSANASGLFAFLYLDANNNGAVYPNPVTDGTQDLGLSIDNVDPGPARWGNLWLAGNADMATLTLGGAAGSGQYLRGNGTNFVSSGILAGDVPNLPASIITTGTLALARGGTNANLSATGGSGQVLQQTSVGGSITVGTLAYSSLTGTPQLPQTISAVSHQWLTSYTSSTGLFTQSQPAASDLSNGVTGSGAVVLASTPSLTTPVLGAATGTSIALASGGFVSFNTDTGISRGGAGILDVGTGAAGSAAGTVNAAQYNVAGSQIAAANLSNGVTGSGAIALAAGPTFTGTLTCATLTATGNSLLEGYLRVGSSSAPANTTAGDLTATRFSLGNGALGTSSTGEVASVTGTMTDTSGTAVAHYCQITLNPASTSSAGFRTLSMGTLVGTGNSQNFTGSLNAVYLENRYRGTGTLTLGVGVNSIGVLQDSSAQACTVTEAVALQAQGYDGFASGSPAIVVTTARGIKVLDSVVIAGTTITGDVGISIGSISAGTNNTHLLIGQTAVPSGQFAIYCSSTSLSQFSGNIQAVVMNATTGFQVNGAAASGNYLRGNGTNFVSSALLATDLTTGTGSCSITVAANPSTLNVTTDGVRDWFAPAASSGSNGSYRDVSLFTTSGVHAKILHDGDGIVNTFDWISGGASGTVLFTQNNTNPSISSTATDDCYTSALSSSVGGQGIDSPTGGVTGFGYRFTVPADTYSRTLKVYGGAFSCVVTITCTVSDGSFSTTTQTFDTGTGSATEKFFTVTYNAGRDGQTLEVAVQCTTNHGSTPNIKMSAITLS